MTQQARIDKGMYWDKALSLVEGCTPVSPGCDHCWSASQAHMRSKQSNPKIRDRYSGVTTEEGKWNGKIKLLWDNLDIPWRTKKPTTFAVWNDLMHEDVPYEFLVQAWAAMYNSNEHTYLVLTKRPERMKQFVTWYIEHELNGNTEWYLKYYSHIWLGITAENQEQFDKRWQCLREIPASIVYISYEPALGPLVLPADFLERGPRAWLVAGAESGHNARPCHPDWIRSPRDQCQAAGVPYFFKQHGEWLHDSQVPDCKTHLDPDYINQLFRYAWTKEPNDVSFKVGKKRAGRLLDGREWNEMPAI